MNVRFIVHGIAQPAGSKRGFINRKTGGVIITDAAKRSRPWKADVSAAAAAAMIGTRLLDGPLALDVVFVVPRPKGHYGSGRNAGNVRASAPMYPAVKPDVTKLLRAVEDACTGIVWRDDAQIVSQHATKRYGAPARCELTVSELQALSTPKEEAA